MRIQKLVHNPLFLQQPARPLHHSLCCVVLRAHRKYQTRPISVDSELNHSLATRKLELSVSQEDAVTHQWLLVNRGWRAPLGLNGPVYLRCPPSCPKPQTPFQPPRAASPCVSNAVQGQSQLPMALPCLDMGPIKPGPQPSPALLPGRHPIPHNGAHKQRKDGGNAVPDTHLPLQQSPSANSSRKNISQYTRDYHKEEQNHHIANYAKPELLIVRIKME